MPNSRPATRVAIAVACGTLLLPSLSHAGLVFEIAKDISVRSIRHVNASPQGLLFDLGGQQRTILMSAFDQRQVMAWAEKYKGGVIVVSLDGALVPGATSYYPPSTPATLQTSLRQWDVLAHQLACGDLPIEKAQLHPLFARDGNDQRFPVRQHERLLDAKNHDVAAFAYRRLAARYSSPPECVGELTLRVTPEVGAWPIRLSIGSWIHPQTKLWYRSTDAPSPRDQVVARIPYRDLKQDIEQRWDQYRRAFPSLDKLSSTVEALTLLQAIRIQRPELWQELRAKVPIKGELLPEQADPMLRHAPLDARLWQQTSMAWIGEHIETSAEANLALNLVAYDETKSFPAAGWSPQIAAIGQRDRRIQAKLELLETYQMPTPILCGRLERVLSLMTLLREGAPESFRLRARALGLLETKLQGCSTKEALDQPGKNEQGQSQDESSDLAASLRAYWSQESEQLLQEFLAIARPRCAATPAAPDDLGPWEDLTQDVYSVGLLFRARNSELYEQVLDAVACVHHRRGLAPQTGREFGYRHAHLRYLLQLTRNAQTTEQRNRMASYAQEIANRLQLAEW